MSRIESTRAAERWLAARLEGGARLVEELRREWTSAGHPMDAIYRARRRLGVRRFKSGTSWFWRLGAATRVAPGGVGSRESRLRELRRGRGWTLDDVLERVPAIGDAPRLSMAERGLVRLGDEALAGLAAAYGVAVADLGGARRGRGLFDGRVVIDGRTPEPSPGGRAVDPVNGEGRRARRMLDGATWRLSDVRVLAAREGLSPEEFIRRSLVASLRVGGGRAGRSAWRVRLRVPMTGRELGEFAALARARGRNPAEMAREVFVVGLASLELDGADARAVLRTHAGWLGQWLRLLRAELDAMTGLLGGREADESAVGDDEPEVTTG